MSKTETFQNDVEYVSKMSFWALVGLILWLYIEKLFWELAEISLHETISVFWSNAESRFGCAICPRTLRSVLWLFTSCVWDVVGYRLVKKKQFLFLEQNRNFPKRRWVNSKKCLFEIWWAWLFGGIKKSCFENLLRSLYMKQYVLFVQMQSHVSAALFAPERYVRCFGSLHPAFEMSCYIEY